MLLLNFYIFIFLLSFTFTSAAFIPNGRYFHSSALIDKKLYFSGGMKSYGITNEFFYLNVSKPFTTTDNVSIPWIDLTYSGGPLKGAATACIGGKNNDMIFIFGIGSNSQSFVNQFDTSKQQWINITSVGNVPTDRQDISCANFDNGLIAIFSGFGLNITNNLWIFNTLTLTWSLSNATNAPSSVNGYCAVTLPDGNILYIGGNMPMNNLPLYNTKSDTWTTSISGQTPSARRFFSAVLCYLTISVNVLSIKFLNKCFKYKSFFDSSFKLKASDGRIIIFGGSNTSTIFGDLWILDITMFQWSIGTILNPIMDLTLYYHTATLVDNYMFVSFGMFQNSTISSKIFMLDVSQKDYYKWVTEFTPTATNTTTTTTTTTTKATTSSSNTSSESKNTCIIIGAIIGSIISLIIVVIASILTLKFIDKQM
ncbi:galactose oxidase [Gigaspora margarita]|uniref:Galactose oxidase n=1 Tax=Gigaspora margarita TaxID=4874 RepID=A0A8H4ERA1_GIGMA|nr:galactose oxidase [Gigaspora margarita]